MKKGLSLEILNSLKETARNLGGKYLNLLVYFGNKQIVTTLNEVCNELSIKISELAPKSKEEFGGKEVLDQVRDMRFSNFEQRRNKKLVQVIKQLKKKKLQTDPKEPEPEVSRIRRSNSVDQRDLDSPYVKKTSFSAYSKRKENAKRRAIAYNNAANQFMSDLKFKIEKIRDKEKKSLEALKVKKLEAEKRQKAFQEREVKRNELLLKKYQEIERKERREIRKQFQENKSKELTDLPRDLSRQEKSYSTMSHEKKVILEEHDDTEERLDEIYQKLNEGTERAQKFLNDISMDASMQASRIIKVKRSEEDQTMKKIKNLHEEHKHHEKLRKDYLEKSIQKTSKNNLTKQEKHLKALKMQKKEHLARERQLREKEMMVKEKLSSRKRQKEIEKTISKEKRQIKKNNQLENLERAEMSSRKRKEKILNKIKSLQSKNISLSVESSPADSSEYISKTKESLNAKFNQIKKYLNQF